MNKIMLIALTASFISLSGCASNGSNQPLQGGTDAGSMASQRSAQTIAPITNYIANVR